MIEPRRVQGTVRTLRQCAAHINDPERVPYRAEVTERILLEAASVLQQHETLRKLLARKLGKRSDTGWNTLLSKVRR